VIYADRLADLGEEIASKTYAPEDSIFDEFHHIRLEGSGLLFVLIRIPESWLLLSEFRSLE
jgi:hypothetical protein